MKLCSLFNGTHLLKRLRNWMRIDFICQKKLLMAETPWQNGRNVGLDTQLRNFLLPMRKTPHDYSLGSQQMYHINMGSNEICSTFDYLLHLAVNVVDAVEKIIMQLKKENQKSSTKKANKSRQPVLWYTNQKKKQTCCFLCSNSNFGACEKSCWDWAEIDVTRSKV